MERRTFLQLASLALAGSTVAPISTSATRIGQAQPEAAPALPRYPNFDLHMIPFSYRGSFHTLALASEAPEWRLRLRTIRHTTIDYRWQQGAWAHDLYQIALFAGGQELHYRTTATPWDLNSPLATQRPPSPLPIKTRC